MSYCRWSSDSFRCDIYCYADIGGGWTIHVAGRRRIMPDDLRDPLFQPGVWGNDMSTEKIAKLMEGHNKFNEELDKCEFEEIKTPSAGLSFSLSTLEETIEKMKELKAEGLNVPDYAIEELEEELKEGD